MTKATSNPELLSWIGREATYTAREELGLASIRYFALALDDHNPLYRDADYAAESRHGGIVAPPTLVCETNQFAGETEDRNGYIGHHWDLPINNGRFMRGSNDYEFFHPVLPSDRVTVKWKITEIYERKTRKLGTLIFVSSVASYYNQDDKLLATNKETNIYQP